MVSYQRTLCNCPQTLFSEPAWMLASLHLAATDFITFLRLKTMQQRAIAHLARASDYPRASSPKLQSGDRSPNSTTPDSGTANPRYLGGV